MCGWWESLEDGKRKVDSLLIISTFICSLSFITVNMLCLARHKQVHPQDHKTWTLFLFSQVVFHSFHIPTWDPPNTFMFIPHVWYFCQILLRQELRSASVFSAAFFTADFQEEKWRWMSDNQKSVFVCLAVICIIGMQLQFLKSKTSASTYIGKSIYDLRDNSTPTDHHLNEQQISSQRLLVVNSFLVCLQTGFNYRTWTISPQACSQGHGKECSL